MTKEEVFDFVTTALMVWGDEQKWSRIVNEFNELHDELASADDREEEKKEFNKLLLLMGWDLLE